MSKMENSSHKRMKTETSDYELCLNEINKCKTAFGHYTLGVFEIEQEEKEQLREVLFELAREIKALEFRD